MQRKKNKISGTFLIGLFVLAGIVILVAAIIWLGKTQFMKESGRYVTYFEGSVEGLEKGSSVKYLGVPVGSVDKIDVAPDGKLVEIVMLIESSLAVDTNLRVKAELAGLAGGKFLQLSYPDKPELLNAYPRLSFKPSHELIRSSPSGIDEIEIAMRDVLNNLKLLQVGPISTETIRFLRSATDFFNDDDLYQTIAKFKESSQKLDNILGKADSANFIYNIESTSANLLKTSNQLAEFGDKLNKQVEDLKLTQKVNYAFDEFDTTVINTRKIINVLGYRTEDILYTLNATLQDLQSTNKQLKKSLKTVTENPSQLLFSEPPPVEK